MTSTPEDFNEWFEATHGTGQQPITSDDSECDSCVEDDYSENTFGDIEEKPLDNSSGFLLE